MKLESCKAGYLAELEKKLDEKLPGCGLKEKPHIESRVKLLKRHCNGIREIQVDGSGIKWDDELKMVKCDILTFDEWAKTHKYAVGLYNRPFPHYDQLAEIFGKDRANRKGAESVADAIEELDREERSNNINNVGHDGLEDIDVSELPTQTSPTTPSELRCFNQPRRKRVRSSNIWTTNMAQMTEQLGHYFKDTQNHLAKLVNCFAYKQEAAEKRSKIIEELTKIPGMSEIDLLTAANKIISDPMKTDLFFALPGNLKRSWVEIILQT